MANDHYKKNDDVPLAESNVSLRLADIQRRCAALLDDPEVELELEIEEPAEETGPHDYFQRG